MGPVNVVKYLLGGMIAPLRYAFYKRRHHYMKRHKPLPQHLTAFAKNCTNPFRLQELEIRSTNLPILLRYEDKNSMAHAIETRLPFLDYRLLETSLSLAGKMKIRDGWSKWILRQAMDNRMPKDVVWRKNKFGFEAPEDAWLTQHASIMKQTVLNSPLLGEMVNKEALTRTYQRLDKRSRWRLYSTALWEKSFGVSA
jgi:asparagine synthase (glutamine-hydrolysing)